MKYMLKDTEMKLALRGGIIAVGALYLATHFSMVKSIVLYMAVLAVVWQSFRLYMHSRTLQLHRHRP